MVTPERSSMLRCTERGFRITDGRFSSALTSMETTATPNESTLSILKSRRIVTGHDAAGKSVFVQTAPAPRAITSTAFPGFAMVELWSTDGTQKIPVSKSDPTVSMISFVPPLGGSRFRMVEFPPASKGKFDAEAFHQDLLKKAPGLAETAEPPDYAMHTTDSVDYGIVISGQMTLVLDDQPIVDLKPGDCVIQNGTRHAWWNRGRRPCVMAIVLVGAM